MNKDQENKPINIVLFENNPGDARLIEEMLYEDDPQSFHITHFERLRDGLSFLQKNPAQIILLNLGLPDSQGVETFTRVNDQYPDTPIIVFAGIKDQLLAASAVCLGAQDYLVKGKVNSSLLNRAIRYAIERKRSHSELAREKAELDALLDSIGDAVIETDTSSVVIRMNHVAEQLTGWLEAQAKGQPLKDVFQLVGREPRQIIKCPVQQIIESGAAGPQDKQVMLVSRNGSRTSISYSVSLVNDPNGKIFGAVLVFHDDTHQRFSQRMLQIRFSLIEFARSHTLEETLTKALDLIGALVDSPIGFYHFLDADQKTLQLSGWSTQTKETYCRAEGASSHYDIGQAGVWVECVYTKAPVIHNDYASLPNKKGMPDGHSPLIRELVVPVLRDNKIAAIMGVGNKPVDYTRGDADAVDYIADVTWHIVEQKRAEEKLRRSENQYRQIVETAGEGIWFADNDNRVVFANEKMAQLLGTSVEQLVGASGFDFYFEEDLPRIKEKIKNRQPGHSQPYEIRYRRADGSHLWVSVNATTLRDIQNDMSGALIMISDISARKAVEQQVKRERDLAQAYFSGAGAILLVLDNEGTILQINKRGLRVLEYESEDELVGRNWFETCIPQDIGQDVRQEIKAIHQKNMDPNKKHVDYHENAVLTKSGKQRFVAWNNTTLIEDENRVYGELSSGEDITERLQAQREIEMLLTLSQQAGSVNNLDELLFLIADRIVEVIPASDAASIFLHDEEKQVIRIQAWSGFETENMQGIEFSTQTGQTGRIFRTKKSEIVNDTSGNEEFDFIDKPQLSHIKSSCAVPLLFNNQVIGIIFVDNLTRIDAFSEKDVALLDSIASQLAGHVKNASLLNQVRDQHDQLQEREEELRNIFENSTNMFFAHSLDRIFTFVSPQCKQILGYEPEELLNQPTRKLVDLPFNKEPLGNTDIAIQTGKRQPPFEIQLRAKNGDLIWVEVRETPVLENGKTVSIIGSLNDITERKVAEKELENNFHSLQSANADLYASNERLQVTMEATIRTIAKTVEARDPYTAGHQMRVSNLAVAIAEKMGLEDERVKAIELAGIIHDLGKIQVPAEILSKPGKLTDIEYSMVKTHPEVGYELLKGIGFPWPLADIILQHHEKMNGSGYPKGLKGDEISLEGRILAVADTVEAMSAHRPYRSALGINAALDQIKTDRATLYDEHVVDACLDLFKSGYQLPSD